MLPTSAPVVLLADDDKLTRETLRYILEHDGYEVVECADGVAAMAACQQQLPDVILLDIRMPELDGIAACKQIRRLSGGPQVPVLMITALHDSASIDQCFEAGATDYITKPINHAILRQRVRRLVRARQAEEALQESEAKYRQLVESLNEGIWMIDEQAVTTFVNPRMADMLGYTVEEILGRPFFAFMDEQGVQIATLELARRQQGIKERHDFEFLRKDGTRIHTTLEASPVTDRNGHYRGAIAGVVDITERVQAESQKEVALEELRAHRIELEMQNENLRRAQAELDAARARYFDLYDLAPVGYCTVSEPGVILEANLTAATLLGVAQSALVKQPITRFILKEDQELYDLHRTQLFATGKSLACELRMAKQDGALFWARLEATAAQDADGELRQRIVLSDITARKQAEEALRQSEARFRNYFEVPFVSTDLDGIIRDANRTAAALLGVRQDFLIGKSLLAFIDETAQALLADQIIQWQNTDLTQIDPQPAILRNQLQLRVYKGATFPAEIALSPTCDALGHITGLCWMLRDLSESTRAAQALQEREYHYRTLFDNAGDAIFIHNLTGRYLEVNQVACESLGYTHDELLRMTPADINAPELVKQIQDRIARLRQEDHIFFETIYIRRDGAPIPMELNSRMIEYAGGPAVLSIARDITERKQAEDELLQQKNLLHTIIESASEAIFAKDIAGRYHAVNEAGARMLGFRAADMIGHTDMELLPLEMASEFRKTDEYVMSSGQVYEREEIGAVNGVTLAFLAHKTPWRDNAGKIVGVIGVSNDITARKRAEEMLTRRAVQLALLNNVGRQIAAILSLDQVLDRAAHLVQESFDYHHVALFLVDHDQGDLMMKAIAGNFTQLFPLDHRIQLGTGMVGWVGAHGQRLLTNDVRTEPHYINFDPDVIPTCSELSVPIRAGEQTVGVLDVQSPVFDDFDENDVKVIETLADQIAVAIANARLYEAAQQAHGAPAA